ncbi:hypothetical protein BMS3Bbin06_01306 [bacterium BMS3Bbin06]|nr:hypothetical protein BMS3Abin08_00089 [bacterium BMS3Abin08]GBE34776.1 hypothetical protein BMS3Bbin06_01306 [bacterium BMS3Bbin06]HDO35395.1 DUF1638 domain-containing protein [Nitrospirota bacterium]HDY70994.1 DUF1638 domain-containing protein [Nitrospirota bacterium]
MRSALCALNDQENAGVIIACKIMQSELEAIRKGQSNIDIRYIDQGLHSRPQKLAPLIQEQIDLVEGFASMVVLGYGLCSNGPAGVTARRQGLIVPRSHDCISFSLGSPDAYLKAFRERPGTYYLTAGWIEHKVDPLGIMDLKYSPRLGHETALWAMKEELRNYTHIALIVTGLTEPEPLRERAMENCRVFEKEYEEIDGSPDYLKRLLRGPYSDEYFIFIEPGKEITQEMFLSAMNL